MAACGFKEPHLVHSTVPQPPASLPGLSKPNNGQTSQPACRCPALATVGLHGHTPCLSSVSPQGLKSSVDRSSVRLAGAGSLEMDSYR